MHGGWEWRPGMAEGFGPAIVDIGGAGEGVYIILVLSGSNMATWMPRFRSAASLDPAFDGGPTFGGGPRAMGFRHHG